MPPPTRPRKRNPTRYPRQIGYQAIAEISGRRYQTVRTWRSQMPDPVAEEDSPIPGAPPSPLFDRDEVVAFLKRTLRLTPDGRPQFRDPARNGKTPTI